MTVELRPLTHDDAEAHLAAEDDATVRWLTGGRGTLEGTKGYFDWLAEQAATGAGKRGWGVWLDGRLAGYVDLSPDNRDGLVEGDVNISYGVHPWARGRGVALEAVRLVCELIRAGGIGTRAGIRVEPENTASVRVAQKAGFTYVRDFPSTTDTGPDGAPVVFSLYLLELEPGRSSG